MYPFGAAVISGRSIGYIKYSAPVRYGSFIMSARVSYLTTASFTPYRASISALFSNAVCADAGVNAGETNAPSTNAAAIKFPFFMFVSMIVSPVCYEILYLYMIFTGLAQMPSYFFTRLSSENWYM